MYTWSGVPMNVHLDRGAYKCTVVQGCLFMFTWTGVLIFIQDSIIQLLELLEIFADFNSLL